ncbi:hypothetical protein RBWH47_00573 [Rhodopirellula baltica WH47]|uniref:Uncharacterized protein n=1 Tax=Rhodopirellula baltica WH47 TaxID=991778 RepID=F2ALC8_RHOBT|nr:hypothetical protein RBWH47_00573 [Rhodopirellula baltica WH47]
MVSSQHDATKFRGNTCENPRTAPLANPTAPDQDESMGATK